MPLERHAVTSAKSDSDADGAPGGGHENHPLHTISRTNERVVLCHRYSPDPSPVETELMKVFNAAR